MPRTLLTLPSEIRNIIFGMVLGAPSGCLTLHRGEAKTWEQPGLLKIQTLEKSQPEHPGATAEDVISLSLLGVCKQIYMDCKGMLWSRNTFVFNGHDLWLDEIKQSFYHNIKPSDLPYHHIMHLELYLDLGQEHITKHFSIWEIGFRRVQR